MAKRLICAVFVFLLFSINLRVCAEDDITALKTKLKNVRNQMDKVTGSYKEDLANVKKNSADKLNVLKNEFHKTRAEYIAERKSREDNLLNAYNKKIEPLKQQEKEFINRIEPIESNNFATYR